MEALPLVVFECNCIPKGLELWLSYHQLEGGLYYFIFILFKSVIAQFFSVCPQTV